jgi:outer membrane protein
MLGLFFPFTVALFGQNSPDSGSFFTLQQCVDSALKNNPTVRLAEFTMKSAKVNWHQQKATMLPAISGYANYGSNSGRSINPYTNSYINQQYNSGFGQLSGSLVLWNGSSIQNFIRQYSLNYEADKMDWRQAKDQLTINVILSYLNVLSTQEQLHMAEKQAEATRGKTGLLEIQNREGAVAPSVLYDMKGQSGADELTVVSTGNALETYKLTLAQYMNIPYSPNLKFENGNENRTPLIYDATIDQIYQNAIQNLALVKAAKLHLASAEKGVKATRGNMLPTLSLSGEVYTNYSSAASTEQYLNTTYATNGSYIMVNNNPVPVYAPQKNYQSQQISLDNQFKNNVFSFIGFTLNVPILNGLRLRSLYRQAELVKEQASFTTKTTLIQLKQAIEQDYVNMTAAYRTYNTLYQQVQDYGESFRAAEIKFTAGAMSSVDYIIAKNNIDRAKLNLIAAKYNYVLQTKVLDYFQGKLTW